VRNQTKLSTLPLHCTIAIRPVAAALVLRKSSTGDFFRVMQPSVEHLKSSASLDYPITVIIPTFNRASALITCLQHLERQTHKEFEVIIVDDGSTDDTGQRVEEYCKNTTLDLRFFRQPNGGPARARNVAIGEARSPLILMIGDDIFASPQLVENHFSLHRLRSSSRVAGLGLTAWEEKKQKVTPFMRFLEEGTQFAYPDLMESSGRIGEEGRSCGRYFYTSNLSVKTDLLRRNPFCERFPWASCEDLELGYRIEKNEGLELVFLPEAMAHHYHPTTVMQACRRMRKAGWSVHLMYEIWPGVYRNPGGSTTFRRMVRKILAMPPFLHVATWASSVLGRFCSPKALFKALLGTYLYLGYKDRESEVRSWHCASTSSPSVGNR
jgi:glycosyltransferase involved in cell wall biosynthesis